MLLTTVIEGCCTYLIYAQVNAFDFDNIDWSTVIHRDIRLPVNGDSIQRDGISGGRIVGGEEAIRNSIPYQVKSSYLVLLG